MTKAAAIYQFWSGFGLTAYEENTVPTDADFPYVTYQLVTDSFDREVAATASLWYRGESWTAIKSLPLRGAWIEMDCKTGEKRWPGVAPPWGAWFEIPRRRDTPPGVSVAPPTGRVD